MAIETREFRYERGIDRVVIESTPPFFPSVALKVTTVCRLHCPFCCEPSRKDDATLKTLNQIIDLLLDNGTRRFCITGGEPVLVKELPAILEKLMRAGAHSVLSVADSEVFLRRYEDL